MEAFSRAASFNDQPRNLSLARIPSNALAVGVFVGRSHASNMAELIRRTPNVNTVALLSGWRRSERFQYVIAAGQLHRQRGEIIGGLCQGWREALTLFCYCGYRFDGIAAARGSDFSTVWTYYLEPAQIQEVSAIVAESMQTAGTA